MLDDKPLVLDWSNGIPDNFEEQILGVVNHLTNKYRNPPTNPATHEAVTSINTGMSCQHISFKEGV